MLAHEITYAINLSRSFNDANVIEKNTRNLLLFRSYSHDGDIDGGYLVERLLLDDELNLGKLPPPPPILFLIVSADGWQVPLPAEVVEECIKKRSFIPISQFINSSHNDNPRPLMSTDSRKGSAGKFSVLEPLLTCQRLKFDSASPSSPIIPMLTSMMSAK